MSIEAAKAFSDRMKNDEEFAKEIMAQANNDDRLALARQKGYDFLAAEISWQNGELSDDELQTVVGGFQISVRFRDISGLTDETE